MITNVLSPEIDYPACGILGFSQVFGVFMELIYPHTPVVFAPQEHQLQCPKTTAMPTVGITMTTVEKEAGPRRLATSRNEGWCEAHLRLRVIVFGSATPGRCRLIRSAFRFQMFETARITSSS